MSAALRKLQRELQRELFGEPSEIVAAVAEAPPLSAIARLGIYRHAYTARLVEALDETYPVLHQILGDEAFEALGHAFIAAHPSEHRSIRWYGGELADFLSRQAPFAEQPILGELARFEWTLSEVFDSADAVPLERAALLQIPPDDWPSLRFRLHPSIRRLAFEWNTVAVWKAVSAQQVPPDPERCTERVEWLLWRRDLENYFRSIDLPEAAALDTARRAGSFEALCSELGAHLPEDEVPMRAAGLLASWLDSGIVVELA